MAGIDFRGVHLFTVTPVDGSGAIAPGLLGPHLDRAIDAGVRSVTVFGSTGGIGSFDEGERKRIAEAAVRFVDGRVPVIVGTGAMTTAGAIRLSVHARRAGADAVLVVPTTYWPLTESELLDHYRAIAEAAALPLVLYNNPRTTGVDMPPALLARLCEIPAVVAVKESAPDVSRIADLNRLTGGRVAVLTGRDPQALDALLVGGSGWFSGGANYMPALCVQIYEHFAAGRVDEARRLVDSIHPLTAFTIAKGGIRCAHAALELQGRSMGPPRLPLQLPGPDDRERLRVLMDAAGLLDDETGRPRKRVARVRGARGPVPGTAR